MLFKTSGLQGRNYGLSFYRIEDNGTETLVLNEYNPGMLLAHHIITIKLNENLSNVYS